MQFAAAAFQRSPIATSQWGFFGKMMTTLTSGNLWSVGDSIRACGLGRGRLGCSTGAPFTPVPSNPTKGKRHPGGRRLAEAVGFDSRLRAWSGPARTLHWSALHSRPFESHQKETPPRGVASGGSGGIRFAPAGLVGAGSDAPQERPSLPALRIPPKGNATPGGGVWRKRWDSNPRTHLWITRFRVEAVMTTSIRFHSLFIIKHFGAKSQENPPRPLDLTFGQFDFMNNSLTNLTNYLKKN